MAAVKTPTAQASDLFDQAIAAFSDAVKAGAKVQEEIGKWWSDAIDDGAPFEAWQKRSQAVVEQAIPASQKTAQEWLKHVEQNYKRSLALLQKAFYSHPTTDFETIREKTQQLWEQSLELVRDNAQAMAEANVKMLEVWAGLLRDGKNGKAKK